MRCKILTLSFLCVLLAGCVNSIGKDDPTAEVEFKVDYLVSSLSRADASSTISSLVMLDYVGDEEQCRMEQAAGDSGFGVFNFEAALRTHDFVFVGHNSDGYTYNRSTNTLTFTNKVLDTFISSFRLQVEDSFPITESVTLSRCVSMFKLLGTDVVPGDVDAVRITFDAYYNQLNASTGYAAGSPEQLVRTLQIPSNAIGYSSVYFTVYGFAPEEGFTTDVHVETLASDGTTLHRFDLPDVPLYKNKVTQYSGKIYSTQSDVGMLINIDDEWDETLEYEF